jgi:VWFA-related protein
MHSSIHSQTRRIIFTLIIFIVSFSVAAQGQEKGGRKPDAQDEVLRVDTQLVQTDVMVFDKNGKFVDNLGREQFELRVDGKPVPVSFFERVTTGNAKQTTERAGEKVIAPKAAGAVAADTRGRTITFFVDDLHLSLDSLGRTREALTYFIEHEMTPWDHVAFVSASGQIGFLQQFTDNKAVLRTALARLKPIPYTVRDTDQPPMTEYIAIRIMNGDRDAADLYIDKIIEGYVSKKSSSRALNRNAVFEMVKGRANQIIFGLQSVTENSLSSLENLLRSTQQISGRKLVFYISDGFFLETKNGISAANTRLEHVIDTATRTGSVIYTIDARGLFALLPDATGERPFDPKGRLDRATVGESMISQDGLAALAGNTGGRFLKNQNYFDSWVSRVLGETSNYYVLAWRPEADEQKIGKFKQVEVSVIGRPDLAVRLNRGYIAGGSRAEVASAKPEEKSDEKIVKATENVPRTPPTSAVTKKSLPTLLSTSFVDVPGSGAVLTSSVQVATDSLNYGEDGKQTGLVDLAGVVFNDQGKQVADFKTRLNVSPLPSESGQGVIYNYRSPLAPGLYQVRVAARDGRGGQTGSASQWIEIPDLSKRQLTLSSLLLGGKSVAGAKGEKAQDAPQIQFSVDRRFPRSSRLDFMLFIYNATKEAAGLTAQVQVLGSDGRIIVDTHGRSLTMKGVEDLARIPYSGSFPLQALAPGHYVLRVTVTGEGGKASATQLAEFTVE